MNSLQCEQNVGLVRVIKMGWNGGRERRERGEREAGGGGWWRVVEKAVGASK